MFGNVRHAWLAHLWRSVPARRVFPSLAIIGVGSFFCEKRNDTDYYYLTPITPKMTAPVTKECVHVKHLPGEFRPAIYCRLFRCFGGYFFQFRHKSRVFRWLRRNAWIAAVPGLS